LNQYKIIIFICKINLTLLYFLFLILNI
jgi:hypothetical protein